MHRTVTSTLKLIVCFAVSSSPWLTFAQDQQKLTEINPSELRFYLQSPGTCESRLSEKTPGTASCGDVLLDMHYVDGVRKILFGDKDLIAFVGNENDYRNEGESWVQPITRLEIKQGNSPVVRRAATGSCIKRRQRDSKYTQTECSANATAPALHVEYTFLDSAGSKLAYSQNVPTDANNSVDIVINLPARMVASMWKRGESNRAAQTATACFKQAQDLRNFDMFLQCISIASAADYLRTTATPGTETMAPELPTAFFSEVKNRFDATFPTKSGKPANIEQLVRSHYSGSVWAVRGAYGSKLDGYSSSSPK